MKFVFDGRATDSPFVDGVWRTYSQGAGEFISVAETHWGMVVTKAQGKCTLTIRGPETKATKAPVPEDAEFFGIIFKLGTFMPNLPAGLLVDGELHLPETASRSVWLHSRAWELPTYENADAFVDKLVRQGLLVYEPIVDTVLQGHATDLSLRSVQRRFLHATGLTHGAVCQIERAKHAAALLAQGVSILDTVDQAAYADQPHLTRSLKRLLGQTPAQLAHSKRSE